MWHGAHLSCRPVCSRPVVTCLTHKKVQPATTDLSGLVEECSVTSWNRPLAATAGLKKPVCVALGKFDGMHQGHRLLAQQAASSGASPYLLSFSGMAEVLGWPARLPLVAAQDRAHVLDSWTPFCKGNTPRQRYIPFTMVRNLSPEAFVQTLVEDLQVSGIVVGQNYRFGYKAAGDSKLLQALGQTYSITVDIVRLVEAGQGGIEGQVSSSKIRNALNCGQMKQVQESLGRPYRLVADIVPEALCLQPGVVQSHFRIPLKFLCNQPPMYDRAYPVTISLLGPASADIKKQCSEDGTAFVHGSGIDLCKRLGAWAQQVIQNSHCFLALDFL